MTMTVEHRHGEPVYIVLGGHGQAGLRGYGGTGYGGTGKREMLSTVLVPFRIVSVCLVRALPSCPVFLPSGLLIRLNGYTKN